MMTNKLLLRAMILALAFWVRGTYGLSQNEHAPSSLKDTIQLNVLQVYQNTQKGLLLNLPLRSATSGNAAIGTDALYKSPIPNMLSGLYGQISGLIVSGNNAYPGDDAPDLYVRGKGTYDNGDMIVYVDGFQTTLTYLQYLSAAEIENISILKDPADLVAFGMKGANGVLWVETKRHHEGQPKIQLLGRGGIEQAIKINKPLRSYDYAYLYNIAASNDNNRLWSPAYTDADLAAYKNGTDPTNHPDVDWFSENLKKSAPYANTSLLLNGGDKSANYFIALDYLLQEGLYNIPINDRMSNDRLQHYDVRTNANMHFFKIFDASVDMGARIEDRKGPNYSESTLWNNMAAYPANIYPIKDSLTQNWSGTTTFPDNPVASLRALGYKAWQDRSIQVNFRLKEQLDFLTSGLYFSEEGSFNHWDRSTTKYTATYARFYEGIQTTTDETTNLAASGTSATSQYDWRQGHLSAGYDRDFGLHEVHSAVGYYQSSYMVDASSNTDGLNTGTNIYYHFRNISGRFHYGYNKKYEAEFGFAYSGSDNYAKDHRWIFYPAASIAWNVEKEHFLQNNPVVDKLKLRISYGKTGNDLSDCGRYLYEQYFVSGGTLYTGSSLSPNSSLITSYTANANITAEKSTKLDFGLEFSIFKHLEFSLDIFRDQRTGIITQNNEYSGIFGTSAPFENIGKVTNRGIEITGNYHNNWGAMMYTIGGMISYYRNKINYESEVPPVNAFSAATGRSIGTPKGLIADGFFQSSDFDVNGNLNSNLPTPAFGMVQPGDIKYKDLDGNGIIDANDVTKIGYPSLGEIQYSFSFKLSYKGWDASVLLQGVSHRSVSLYSSAAVSTVAFVGNANVFPLAKGAWSYYPDEGIDTRNSATYPRLTTGSNSNNYRASSFWEKSGDFLRVRNVEIGYQLVCPWMQKCYIKRLRLFVNAYNPFTWSSLMRHYNMDPEVLTGYPLLKAYTGGFSVDF